MFEQQLQFALGLGVAGEHEFAPVGGGDVYVDHLHGSELLQCAARRQARGQCFELAAQRDVQAVSRQSEAMKQQQQKIEDLTGRVIRLEAQLELLMGAAMVGGKGFARTDIARALRG